MALKRLSVEEMVQLSTPWVTRGSEARRVIEDTALLAPLLPLLEEAHQAVFEVRPRPVDAHVQSLADEAVGLDTAHDELVRGVYGALSSVAYLAENGAQLLALRERLFPEGLTHTQKSYRGQAGHAALAATRLDEGARRLLRGIVFAGGSLQDAVDRWLETAAELGRLEDERAQVGATNRASPAETSVARNAWVRAATALFTTADLAQLTERADQLLFGPLRQAERIAESRRKSKSLLPPKPAGS
jgi:hypothetical protein